MDTLATAVGGIAGEVGGLMLAVCLVATIALFTDREIRATRARNAELRTIRRHERAMDALGRRSYR